MDAHRNSNGTSFGVFLGVVTLIASAIGSLFMITYSHSGEPKHPEAAHERDVRTVEIKVEGIAVEVRRNKTVLAEVKQDIKELRMEQRAYTDTILRAIRESN